jgi:hypothetical protein
LGKELFMPGADYNRNKTATKRRRIKEKRKRYQAKITSRRKR